MKKLLLSFAALLLASLALSQEADDFGSYAEVTLIPRLELNPSIPTDSDDGLSFGNSSFYTLFEGSFSEHVSWTIANHWLHVEDGTSWLYEGIGRSDATNFLDYLLLDFNYGNWTFSLGKDMISTGGYEFDDWDWDVYTHMASPLWNGLASYQWGGKISWANAEETTAFSLQMTSSPYGEHPFSSGLWAYSGQWVGEYGPYSLIGSVSALQADKGDYDILCSLGQRLSFDEFSFTLDWSNMAGFDEDWRMGKGNYFLARADYAASDKWAFQLRAGYVAAAKDSLLPSYWNVGAVAEFYPLTDSDALRLHAYAAYNSLLTTTSLSIGARYNFSFKVW